MPKFKFTNGRRSIRSTLGGGSFEEKWHQKLNYLKKPKGGKAREIRMVGGMFAVFQHYVKFRRKKDGSKSGFYEVCPDFNLETGEFVPRSERTCPICADFSDNDLPRDLQMFGAFRYFIDAFDITAAKAGNIEDLYGVVQTNRYGRNDLSMMSDIMGVDVDDLDQGCTVHWHHNENAADPRERTRFYQGQKMKAKYNASTGHFMVKGGGKVFRGEPTDFLSIVQVKSADEIKGDLERLGVYEQLSEVVDVISAGDSITPSVGNTAEEVAEDAWGDDSDTETTKKKPSSKKAKKVAPEPAPSDDDDDDWGDSSESAGDSDAWADDEPAEAAADDDDWGDGKSSDGADEDWGDETPEKDSSDEEDWGGGDEEEKSGDDDFDNSFFDDDDEEEPPAKKKTRKAAGKNSSGKKKSGGKKASPKKASPPADDDWEDDDDPDNWG